VTTLALALAFGLLAATPAVAGQAGNAGEAAATPPASAAEKAERERIADAIMAEANVVGMLDQMVPAMLDQMMPSLIQGNSGREDEIRRILSEELGGALKQAGPAIVNRSRDLYVERFSAAELGEMLAFNRSPTGRKATRLLPEIQMQMFAYGQQAGQAAVAAVMPRIIDRLKAANVKLPTTS
jgi:hypothetical protein